MYKRIYSGLFVVIINQFYLILYLVLLSQPVHSKKCWVVSTQIWVKYGQTQMLG